MESFNRELWDNCLLMSSSFYSARGYVDVCSNALLFALNDLYVPGEGPASYVDLDGGGGDLLRHYVRVQLDHGRSYGSRNIIVGTCHPLDNWRSEERGSPVDHRRLVIADESVELDQTAMNRVFDEEWSRLTEENPGGYVFVDHPSLDSFDLTTIIGRLLDCKPSIRPYGHLLLRDGNDEYIHYDTLKRSFHTEMEMALRRLGVIV